MLPPSYDTSSHSWLGGGQIGCNWQQGLWVFGVEGDIDAVNLRQTAGFTTQPVGTFIGPITALFSNSVVPNLVLASEHVSQHWLSTVRGRLGFAPTQQLFIYGTGGLAIGEVSTTGSVTAGVTNLVGATIVWTGSSSETRVGYAVGAGAEYAVASHWSLKGEYIYYNLGTVSHPLGLASNSFVGDPGFATLGNTSTRIDGNMVRVGLNYQFH